MISKWFEVSVDLFNIIFDTYWKNKKSWIYDNIIEIQNPRSILSDQPSERLYLGYKINIEDYKNVFTNFLKIHTIEALKESGCTVPNTYMSICMITSLGPDIIPLQHVDKHSKIVLDTCYGEDPHHQLESFLQRPLTSWYVKENDKYIIGGEYPVEDRFIRFRLIDYTSWKEMIEKYQKEDVLSYLYPEDDIPKKLLMLSDQNPSKPYM